MKNNPPHPGAIDGAHAINGIDVVTGTEPVPCV